MNNKALLPQRDTISTMTFLHDYRAQLYISGARKCMSQVSKTGTSITFELRYVLKSCTKIALSAACMLRPGIIQPLNGIASKTRSYRLVETREASL